MPRLELLFNYAAILTASLVNAMPNPEPATADSILAEYVLIDT